MDFVRSDLKKITSCPICMMPLNIGDIVTNVPCGHVFHENCSFEANNRGIRECCLCKTRINHHLKLFNVFSEGNEESKFVLDQLVLEVESEGDYSLEEMKVK